MRFVPTRLTPKGKVKPRGQAPAPIPSQTTLGQRLLRGLPGSLRRVRHGGALYRAHPPLPAHDHRPRQPLCPNCFILALYLGDRGASPRQRACRTLRGVGQNREAYGSVWQLPLQLGQQKADNRLHQRHQVRFTRIFSQAAEPLFPGSIPEKTKPPDHTTRLQASFSHSGEYPLP